MASKLREFEQSPAEVLDYGFLYSADLLDGDTIATSSWAVTSGITSSSASVNSAPIVRCNRTHAANTATAIFVTGGVIGLRYLITNTITTALGRTYVRRLRLLIKEPDSE